MKVKFFHTWKPWLPKSLTLLSAAFIILAFPPWNLWPLLWICLVPWFFAIKETKTLRQATVQGLWLGYFISLGAFYWIAFAIREFGNVPWILAGLGLQIFCFIGQPHFILFAPLFKKYPTTPKLFFVLILSCFFVGLEWALPKMFSDTLGHAFYQAENLRQAADLGGVRILTFAIFLVNYALWLTIKYPRHLLSRPNILALFLCGLLWIYGVYRKTEISKWVENPKYTHFIQGAAIQGNIGDFDKVAAERGVTGAARKVIDLFMDMTLQALTMTPRPQFIVWPETAFPSTFRKPHTHSELRLNEGVEDFVHQIQTPLLFGGYDNLKSKDFNAFFFLAPNGEIQTYRKNILLHFGEYIPGADHFDFIKTTFPQVGNFGRGIGPEVLSVDLLDPESQGKSERILVSPIICYEVLFPNYLIESARKKSQLIVNITNDSWFGTWGEPQLHLALAIFRSIETRLPMLRTTNTGISALITPDGTITHPTPIGVPKILNVSIPITEPIPTLIKATGDQFGLLALVIGIWGLFFYRRLSKV